MKTNLSIFLYLLMLPVFFGIGFFIGSEFFGKTKGDSKELAKDSLMALVENPKEVKIDKVSEPIPVYGRNYVTDPELQGISTNLSKLSNYIMNKTANMDLSDYENPEVSELMQRQMSAVAFLRSLNAAKDENSKQTGWKVKIEFHNKTKEGVPIHAEYWAIMDIDSKYVLNSFEIPLL